MKKLHDFKCNVCQSISEHWASDYESILCDICKTPMNKIITGGHFSLDHISGDFPSSTQKWAKDRQVKIAKERKVERNHGPQSW